MRPIPRTLALFAGAAALILALAWGLGLFTDSSWVWLAFGDNSATPCSNPKGKVKWFNTKGFGFIAPDDGGKDLFFHFAQIQMKERQTLQEGQRVCYDVTNGPKGPQATKVSIFVERASTKPR